MRFLSICLLVSAALLTACERAPRPAPPLTSVRYEVRGVLQSTDVARGRAVIAHEAIPGYMAAMTMEFIAAQPTDLAELVPGDVLTFRLQVRETQSRIEDLRKVAHTTLPPPPPAPTLDPHAELLPDAALVDERGQPFRLADMKGGALAVTFIFTRCPLPEFCPRMSAQFAIAQRELIASAPDGKWRLLSITMDPAYDTPARLAEYATHFHPLPERWKFATGEESEIAKLGSALGLIKEGTGAALTHNLRTIVVDPTGRVQRVFMGNEWQPSELVDAMKQALKAR